MKKIINLISILILLSILSYIGLKSLTKSYGVENGEMAPNFTIINIHGNTFNLEDHRGKYVLIDFWGSWCGPCLKDLPKLVKLHQTNPNVEIVSIALEKTNNRWENTSKRYGLDWEHQIVELNAIVMMSSIGRKYGVADIPVKFLITPEGKLLKGLSFAEINKILNK